VASTVARIPAELLESELFGMKKVPFTGAITRSRAGASSWPLAVRCFLTRLATMSAPDAVKPAAGLARADLRARWQQQGANGLIVRVSAATHTNLEQMKSSKAVSAGSVLPLHVFRSRMPANARADRRADVTCSSELITRWNGKSALNPLQHLGDQCRCVSMTGRVTSVDCQPVRAQRSCIRMGDWCR